MFFAARSGIVKFGPKLCQNYRESVQTVWQSVSDSRLINLLKRCHMGRKSYVPLTRLNSRVKNLTRPSIITDVLESLLYILGESIFENDQVKLHSK